MVNDIDRLFALRALKKRVDDEYKILEGKCRQELLEANAVTGDSSRRSNYFGREAGVFSVKASGGSKPHEVVDYALCDDEALAEWLEDNVDAAVSYAKLNAAEFGRSWFERTGELPDGISRVVYEEPGKEPVLSAQFYSFKADVVMEKLGNGNIFAEVDRLMLGGGEEG